MASLQLKTLVSPRSGQYAAIQALRGALGCETSVLDFSGKVLLGEMPADAASARVPIQLEDATLGFVVGPATAAEALLKLLTHFASRETEGRALASEVLHLYREIHLIEQLSEQLAPLLEVATVGQAALEQAQRLISATHGCMLVMEKADVPLRIAAGFGAEGDSEGGIGALRPGTGFAASILERGVAEIVNDVSSDPRASEAERELKALICAPLRTGQRMLGLVALASTEPGAAYSAADLKLLNTIALLTAAAIENALLCEEMVIAERGRAALAAELQAASTVQQLLLQSASRPTPGFQVDSVYLPASEVGGDFFYVSPAPDGSLTAIVGDVSGKGLTAAMRVAMILGALRRESSHDPDKILFGLNNALIAQGQLGFTTACCIRVALSGEFSLANAGHISPYLSGEEVESLPALPLGLVADQYYQLVSGRLTRGERIVLMSDGVPEARSQGGDLLGFERLPRLTQLAALQIAEAAQEFGQEDDITVLSIGLADR